MCTGGRELLDRMPLILIPCIANMLMPKHGNSYNQKTAEWKHAFIGGGDIHIFVFTDLKNSQFQKKLIMKNTNI